MDNLTDTVLDVINVQCMAVYNGPEIVCRYPCFSCVCTLTSFTVLLIEGLTVSLLPALCTNIKMNGCWSFSLCERNLDLGCIYSKN